MWRFEAGVRSGGWEKKVQEDMITFGATAARGEFMLATWFPRMAGAVM